MSLSHLSSLLKCGHRLSTLTRSIVNSVAVVEDGKGLSLLLKKKEPAPAERKFRGIWLRHNCRCPQCFHQPTAMTHVHPKQLSMDLKIKSAQLIDDLIHIKWTSETVGNHEGYLPVQWLEGMTRKQEYNRESSEPLIASSLPTMDFNELIESSEGTYKWLKQLNYYGIMLIENAGTSLEQLPKIASIFPHTQKTIFGEFSPVIVTDNPTDLGYSNSELHFHQDLLFYESPPGLELFHCIRRDSCVDGGENIFLDLYPVVKKLRETFPRNFETLTKVPVTFQNQYFGDSHYEKQNFLSMTRPHIQLDRNGEIAAINWNTHHQKPIDSDNEELVEDYYKAFLCLSQLIEESQLKIQHCLQHGEIICFNNRRFLHSRNSFRLNGGVRHFNTVYLSIDYLKSQFIVLGKTLNKNDQVKNVFAYSM